MAKLRDITGQRFPGTACVTDEKQTGRKGAIMTRDVMKIDLTHDVISTNERLAAIAYLPAKDPHLTNLNHVAWWMVAVLFMGWIVYNL